MSPPSKCLYETLGVHQNASDSEIKKAYRTLALERHPDKNPGDRDNAEEAFKELRHAYDILSNPHERAWYDGHREEILRGMDPSCNSANGKNSSTTESRMKRATNVDIQSYFNSSVFNGFDDNNPKSFFRVFGDMFDRLAREEEEGGGEQELKMPGFGAMNMEWEQVRRFYNEWEMFSSRKTFAFADVWNVADVPRGFRREMERENKRMRAKAKKEFNGAVRDIVAYVKKKDPRVLRRRAEEEELKRKEEERKRELRVEMEKKKKEELEKLKILRQQALEEDGEALDSILAGIALDERIERKEKREKRRRKKQKQQQNDDDDDDNTAATATATAIRQQQPIENDIDDSHNDCEQYDDEHVNDVVYNDNDNNNNNNENGDAAEADTESVGEEEEDNNNAVDYDDEDEDDDADETVAEELYCAACRKLLRTAGQMADHVRSKKHKSAAAKLRRQMIAEEAEFMEGAEPTKVVTDDDDNNENKSIKEDDDELEEKSNSSKKKKKKKKKKQQKLNSQPLEEDGDGDTTTAQGENKAKDEDEEEEQSRETKKEEEEEVKDEADEMSEKKQTLSKREKRKLREQRKREEEQQKRKAGTNEANSAGLACNKCGARFESRSKLMKHVRDKGHALHVDSQSSSRKR